MVVEAVGVDTTEMVVEVVVDVLVEMVVWLLWKCWCDGGKSGGSVMVLEVVVEMVVVV